MRSSFDFFDYLLNIILKIVRVLTRNVVVAESRIAAQRIETVVCRVVSVDSLVFVCAFSAFACSHIITSGIAERAAFCLIIRK